MRVATLESAGSSFSRPGHSKQPTLALMQHDMYTTYSTLRNRMCVIKMKTFVWHKQTRLHDYLQYLSAFIFSLLSRSASCSLPLCLACSRPSRLSRHTLNLWSGKLWNFFLWKNISDSTHLTVILAHNSLTVILAHSSLTVVYTHT